MAYAPRQTVALLPRPNDGFKSTGTAYKLPYVGARLPINPTKRPYPPYMYAFEQRLAAAWSPPAWRDVTVLLAVSGGSDSVALLRAMVALKREAGGPGQLVVAHFNHHLRGAEADEDERFVVEICQQLEVPCQVGHWEPGPIWVEEQPSPTGSTCRAACFRRRQTEAAARDARYDFLERIAGAVGARYVCTAHTADDQAETILHRIIRGTGLRGLAGIRRARPLGPATLIRPMLSLRRGEAISYLREIGQSYRGDSSNLTLRFTRNRIRQRLLPHLLAEFNPRVVEALLRLGQLAADAQVVVDRHVEALRERHVHIDAAQRVEITARGLAAQPRHVIRELLAAVWRAQGWPMQAMGKREWSLLESMLRRADAGSAAANINTENGPLCAPSRRSFPGKICAEITPEGLRMAPLRSRNTTPE